MKNIAVVTGTRAEYGILQPVLQAIKTRKDLKLQLVVAGMHLSKEFGSTVDIIEKDGYTISARVEMLPENDSQEAMAESVGRGIIGMAQAWQKLKPDIILVLGDRIEPLAAAISGAYMNILVAHIHGGDSSKGGLDEYARHAITKFAHIHFPATRRSARRIIRMGEDKWRVHMVGSPALDAILNESPAPEKEIVQKLHIDTSKPLILLVQHPVTTEPEKAGAQMAETLQAVVETGYPAIVLYPNADSGGRGMIKVIEAYGEMCPGIRVVKNLPRREYLCLLSIAGVLVGNSSSGMIDAPSFGLPVVNIGARQEGRERGENVIDVAHDKNEIKAAINQALTDKEFLKAAKNSHNPYGDGKAGLRIAKILSGIEKTPELLQKRIAY